MTPVDLPSMKMMLACSLLMGGATAFVASRYRNRKPISWFIFGFCFGCLALIALFLLPKLSKEKPVLAVESISLSPKEPVMIPQDLWYFLRDGNQIGPISFTRLKTYYSEGTVNSSSYVWNEKLSDWKQLGELPEHLIALESSPPSS